jgi:hypothetical protein
MLQRHIPDEWLSRVTSYDWFGSFAFYPLGLAAWGAECGRDRRQPGAVARVRSPHRRDHRAARNP